MSGNQELEFCCHKCRIKPSIFACQMLHIYKYLVLFIHLYSAYVTIILQTLSPSINNVLNCIDKALAERDANVDKFCTHLDKDISELAKEVKEIKQESQVSDSFFIRKNRSR